MTRLAAVHLSELKFGHLKNAFQTCLAKSDLQQKPVNLQSIKNKVDSMIFSRYAQDSGNVTLWRLGDISFQVSPELIPLDPIRRLSAAWQLSSCRLSHLARQKFFPVKILQLPTKFFSLFTGRDIYSFEFFFISEKYFKINS